MKTYETVLADLRTVVQGREDYVYVPAFWNADREPDATDYSLGVTCTYTTQDGKPSCVVGHVIAIEFPDLLPTIRDDEWHYVDKYPEDLLLEPRTEGVISISESYSTTLDWQPKARYLLMRMQAGQDIGTPWGKALEDAIKDTEAEYGA